MKRKALVIILLALIISGCHKTASNLRYDIDAENPGDEVNLKLTDLADSFKLIKLETTEGSLLNDQTEFYVNEDFILAYSENGIFKFSPSGKFLKKVIGLGRGPTEIVNFAGCTFVVDEKNEILYISNRVTYLRYDLRSEHFIEPVKQANNASGYFDIVNDSVIIVSSRWSDSKFAVYYQNLKGEFLSGLTNTKKFISRKKELPQLCILLKHDPQYYCWFQYDDTLFQVKDNTLVPFLALNFKDQRDNPPKQTLKDGDRFIYYQSGTPSFIIIHVEIVEDARSFFAVPSGGKGYYLLFNHFSGKASKINSYTDNFIGATKDPKTLSQVDILNPFFLKLSPNGRIITAYYPNQIKKAIDKGLNNKEFPIDINEQLIEINKNLQETDNPVLLVGKIKDEI